MLQTTLQVVPCRADERNFSSLALDDLLQFDLGSMMSAIFFSVGRQWRTYLPLFGYTIVLPGVSLFHIVDSFLE